MSRFGGVSILFGIMLLSDWALAFVCTRVQEDPIAGAAQGAGPSLSWYSRQLPYSLNRNGTRDISGDIEFGDLRAAFQVWVHKSDSSSTSCPDNASTTADISFVERRATELSSSSHIGYNFLAPDENENLLFFHDHDWPHAGTSGQIIALTTTSFNALTGEIFDADIEFNSDRFTFTSTAADHTLTDIKNTAVHEIGHFIGLGHSNDPDATMYARADLGDITKRDLACDDLAGLVFKYPKQSTNGYCQEDNINSDCGHCAPPEELQNTLSVSVIGTDDGSNAGGCATTNVSGLWLAIGWLLLVSYRVVSKDKEQTHQQPG